VEVARLLLEHGADPTAEDKDKQTPLQVASSMNPKVAQLLLEHIGGGVAQDNMNQTSSQAASADGHHEVTQLPWEDEVD
jgi:ankyrin repeat protein